MPAVIALSARNSQPGRQRPLRSTTRRAACGLAALAALSLHPAKASAQQQRSDPWWGADKALHFGVSAGLAAGGYGLGALLWKDRPRRALAGATLALGAGAGKELWDLTGSGSASWKDLAWDAAGAALGVGLALSVDFGARGLASEPRRATVALSGAW